MITKAMLAKCQNNLCQPMFLLPSCVQDALRSHRNSVQKMWYSDALATVWWEPLNERVQWVFDPEGVYRLSPSTPTEPEVDWVEYDVFGNRGRWMFRSKVDGIDYELLFAVSRTDGLGIIYRDKDGVETLRTSIDLAFGVPVRVRFKKEAGK